jgi:hypothetical protein
MPVTRAGPNIAWADGRTVRVMMADDNDWDGMAGLSAPARRALVNAGYTRLAQLVNASGKEVRAWHGMGPKAFEVLRHRLAEEGLSFADPP